MESKKMGLKYLALGDSYTLGEGVTEGEGFPEQLESKLNKMGIPISMEHRVAETGWTTGQFIQAMSEKSWFHGETFDLITLLLGVNNQYRGDDPKTYEREFSLISEKCLEMAGGQSKRVYVLSIPDWGVTPYAASKGINVKENAKVIDSFNAINRMVSAKRGFNYVEITAQYREIGGREDFLSLDLLHPNASIYSLWAEEISSMAIRQHKHLSL
ncbi:SGNH/GDSL hydrolase family protein [Pleomorphovibrio marinus]|uniref:SGNH/GDSL hydrolase family protein n=1 Tax=Pleomorphovibrio marinus TaxID=2164132 RepID=UPI000E0BFE57|nr:GDSL-type esterase/lipase family protein [Pleomorphovibrio marinus]